MTLAPVPSDQPEATCANCNAALVADQRYCLSCGQPVSQVRLAFLDVLAPSSPAPPAGSAPAAWSHPATIEATPAGFVTYQPQRGANAWLRRNSGLLGLVAVLGLFLLAGLLVGHWVSQSKTPANTTVKIEGLGGLAAAGSGGGAASTTPAESSSATPAASKSSTKQEAKEAAEGAHETKAEKAPPKPPKKISSGTIQKLTQSKGKKHQEEINALGAEPIETG
jgi:hypothetical protein